MSQVLMPKATAVWLVENSTLTFDRVSGEFLWTVKLIRADLYQGQPCGSGGEPYRFIALIGYYECVHA